MKYFIEMLFVMTEKYFPEIKVKRKYLHTQNATKTISTEIRYDICYFYGYFLELFTRDAQNSNESKTKIQFDM